MTAIVRKTWCCVVPLRFTLLDIMICKCRRPSALSSRSVRSSLTLKTDERALLWHPGLSLLVSSSCSS